MKRGLQIVETMASAATRRYTVRSDKQIVNELWSLGEEVALIFMLSPNRTSAAGNHRRSKNDCCKAISSDDRENIPNISKSLEQRRTCTRSTSSSLSDEPGKQ